MLKKFLFAIIFAALAFGSICAQSAQNSADTVMILPFENTSGKAEFNWVGESFASSLTDLLSNKGLNIISDQERKINQRTLNVSLTSIPSLATSVKIAQKSKATLLVVGNYNIPPTSEDTAVKVYVRARIIRVNEGKVLSEDFAEGRRVDFIFEDALGNLQTIQGQLAREILYRIDKVLYKLERSFPFTEQSFVDAANKVPAKAFEAYIKGLQTTSVETREIYFKNALRLYAEDKDNAGRTYSAVALELGHLYLNQSKFQDAVENFERVINAYTACKEIAKTDTKIVRCSGEEFAEASFYIGLIYWQQKNYEQASSVLRSLADDLKITSVYNTLGAVEVQASRVEKSEGKADNYLTDGTAFLKKASTESSSEDANAQFNYALALFLGKNYKDSAEQLKSFLAKNSSDGEAYFLSAKAFEKLGDATKADFADNQARRFLTENNRYANLQKDWQKQSVAAINLRVAQPARREFLSVVLTNTQTKTSQAPINEAEGLLAQARTLYKDGKDDEAMDVLRRLFVSEPMSGESRYLFGMIHLRRGNLDEAVSNLKTALFWDPKLINAHVALGKIYIEKRDCQMAQTYSVSALKIDEKNEDALGLQRLVERCSK